MGFLGKASEFFAAPGARVGSFVGDALHNVSNFACQLHYNTPGVVFDLSPFNRELWKELCKDRPSGLPPTPALPFVGGQCLVAYSIYLDLVDVNGNPDPNVLAGVVNGPVGGVRLVPHPDGSSNNGVSLKQVEALCRGGFGSPPQPQAWVLIAERFGFFRSISATRLSRRDGQPDNCGDVEVDVQPVIIPVEQRTTNISILSVDQSVTNDVTAIVDFPSASVDFNLVVPLRVTIDNKNFYLSIDGWYSGQPENYAPPDLTPVENNILNIEGQLNQYFSPINPSIDNTLVLVSPSAGKDSDEQENVPGAAWLIIDLTKMPDKAQYGGDSPTVYFAGWIEFLKEGRAFPRQQINFERSIFRFPDGADGYAYTFTNGAQGNVSVYVEEAQ